MSAALVERFESALARGHAAYADPYADAEDRGDARRAVKDARDALLSALAPKDQQRTYDYGEGRKDQADQDEELLAALRRLERAVDLHLGRSSWTQTKTLKGLGYSEDVRKELYAAHDAARAAIAKATGAA